MGHLAFRSTVVFFWGLGLLLGSSASALDTGPSQTTISDGFSLPGPLINPSPDPGPGEASRILVAGPTFEDRVIEQVNLERLNNGGLPPLKHNALLDTSSETHSLNMGDRDFFAHCDPDTGTLPWDRMSAAGYQWSFAGENIAVGYGTPEQVMTGWMNSTGHRNNILSTSYREMGVGYYYQGTDSAGVRTDSNGDCVADGSSTYPYFHYWTQNFGSRAAVYPVVINREAYATADPLVELYVYGAGWATQMRLRNENGSWGAWLPFSAYVPNWQLSTGSGVKEVLVEIQNGSGTVLGASDTIILEGELPPSVPPPPENVAATDGLYTDSIGVSWDPALGATRYELYRATALTAQKTKIMDALATEFDDTSAGPETLFYYWVTACNEAGCSGLSAHDTGYRRSPPVSTPSSRKALPAILDLLFN
jgi:uncharacterized protein YkwD